MPTINVTRRDGSQSQVSGDAGTSVMEILRDAGIDDIVSICGGVCACATCHVFVEPDQLGRFEPMTEDENDLLDNSDYRTAESRLSCQLIMTDDLDGLSIRIAPED